MFTFGEDHGMVPFADSTGLLGPSSFVLASSVFGIGFVLTLTTCCFLRGILQ